MPVITRLKEIYRKDKVAYEYMAVVFLGWSIFECFSRMALTWENARLTWTIQYVYSVIFAISGLIISANALRKLHIYACKRLKARELYKRKGTRYMNVKENVT